MVLNDTLTQRFKESLAITAQLLADAVIRTGGDPGVIKASGVVFALLDVLKDVPQDVVKKKKRKT